MQEWKQYWINAYLSYASFRSLASLHLGRICRKGDCRVPSAEIINKKEGFFLFWFCPDFLNNLVSGHLPTNFHKYKLTIAYRREKNLHLGINKIIYYLLFETSHPELKASSKRLGLLATNECGSAMIRICVLCTTGQSANVIMHISNTTSR